MPVDFPDGTAGYTVVPGSLYGVVAQDFPDWTNGVTAIAGPITANADFPDWTKAVSDATPTTPLTGMLVWFDATQIAGHSDGDALTSVADLSGHGYNSTGANVHYWSTTTVHLINGHPGLTFDNLGAGLPQSFPTLPQPFTIFVVCQTANLAGAEYLWSAHDSGPLAVFINNAGQWQISNVPGGFPVGPAADTQAHIVSQIMTGTTGSEFLIDGLVVNSGNGGSKQFIPGWFGYEGNIGTYWLGSMGEILVYNYAMNPAQHAAIYTYLHNKWGTP